MTNSSLLLSLICDSPALVGEMAGRPEGVESQQALDHDIFRSGRPENMNVIDSKKLRPGMRAENRTHFSSSRSSAGV
ncbi:hypothetical protein CN233_32725 [Sinorhizobium meliloti]|nr:hypothetical protein CN233_32725 [Sinorhizobium meliloti]